MQGNQEIPIVPLKLEFKIPKLKDGKPLKNEAGDPVYITFIYCFEEMGMDRKLMARKFFHLSSRNLINLPKEPEHVVIIADRMTEVKAFSAILMRVMDDGSYELYDPAKTELNGYEMSQIGIGVDWEKLTRAQEDFFSKARLQSTELMAQSNDITMQSLAIMTEITKLAGESGIQGLDGMKDFTNLILDKALQVPESKKPPTKKSSKSSTT